MPTAFDDLYAAAKALMAAANTAATETVFTQAPTNYGTDFRITPGAGLYQIQISPQKKFGEDSNLTYPRAIVTVLVHHYVTTLANEESFLHDSISFIADELLVGGKWSAEAGVFDLNPGIDPEVEDGGRVGNVITFEFNAVVLADAV